MANANTSKGTKRIVDPATGIVIEVAIETDNFENVKRFELSQKIQASMRVSLDSAAASTVGKGKHTGNMQSSMAARGYKGAVTRTAWTRQRRARDAKSLANQDALVA